MRVKAANPRTRGGCRAPIEVLGCKNSTQWRKRIIFPHRPRESMGGVFGWEQAQSKATRCRKQIDLHMKTEWLGLLFRSVFGCDEMSLLALRLLSESGAKGAASANSIVWNFMKRSDLKSPSAFLSGCCINARKALHLDHDDSSWDADKEWDSWKSHGSWSPRGSKW